MATYAARLQQAAEALWEGGEASGDGFYVSIGGSTALSWDECVNLATAVLDALDHIPGKVR